jgi:hypothetical protein
MCSLLTAIRWAPNFRMDEDPSLVEGELTTPPPPSTPAPRAFKVGDLVQVFNGTAPNVRAARTVAYIGRIVGYNDDLGKWEVHSYPNVILTLTLTLIPILTQTLGS